MTKPGTFISFAEGRLTEAPVRLDLIADAVEWCAIAKPPGLLVAADPWYPGETDLVSALRAELSDGKPQLVDLGLVAPMAVNRPDRDESGVVVLAKTEAAGAALRNLAGSGGLRLTYSLLAEGPPGETLVSCDLPLARHKEANRVLVSTQTGKKTRTTFRLVESFGQVQLWQAETDYARLHQIRVHAVECGLGILGESLYNAIPAIFLSQLKRGFRKSGRPEAPIYPHLALHLSSIEGRMTAEREFRVEAPWPKGFAVLIKRLREFSH